MRIIAVTMSIPVRLAILAAFMLSALPAQAQTTGGVRGYVRELPVNHLNGLGAAVAGATVRVWGRNGPETTTKTDSHGFYVIFGLPPGIYEISADAGAHTEDPFGGWRSICIHAGNVEYISLTVVPPITMDWDYESARVKRLHDRYLPSQTQTSDLYSVGDC